MTKPKESKIVDPEVKRKWIEALRSGEYTQGDGKLKGYHYRERNDDGQWEKNVCHCCLGVLLEVTDPDGFKENKNDEFSHTSKGSPSSQKDYPNEKTMRELGLTRKTVKQLAIYNDESGWSFGRIADHIEANL